MTDLKCIRCGTLTIGTNQICKICEIELNPISPSPSGSGQFPSYQPLFGSDTPDTKSPTIRPFQDVGDILQPTLSLFTKQFWLITKLSIVIFAPFEIFKALSLRDIDYEWQLTAGLFVLELLCTILVAPALIYALMHVRETGIAPGINESYRWGISKLPKLSVCAVISWIAASAGFMLCIIPGILISLSLFLVIPIAVLEKGSLFEPLSRSSELTKGHRWNIFLAGVAVFLLTLLFSVPAEMIGEYLGAREFAFWPLRAAASIFSDIMHQSNIVLALVTYLSIRALWSQSTQ